MPSPLPLARHYYETRREILASCGATATPWFRLTPDERAVAVAEAEIILEALRRAHREQDIVEGRPVDTDMPRETWV
ncbi:hypothetical protein ACIQU6_28080 [Streptomyces sp. NPDC090442]|uniref:hypothetical protein n=1 Tax=Streptomyces sp. NPDC090442 TaxID=3365962 RepID=UPI003813A982